MSRFGKKWDMTGQSPRIEIQFKDGGRGSEVYESTVRRLLSNLVDEPFFFHIPLDRISLDKMAERLRRRLPVFKEHMEQNVPSNLHCQFICEHRCSTFKFVFEMLSSWLLPGQRLNVQALFAADFKLPELGQTVYTVGELIFHIRSPEDFVHIRRNMPAIKSEVSLGMQSLYHARKMLEMKGLQLDEKTAMIQEYIAHLRKRLPHEFDQDLFVEAQHVLVRCSDEFKTAREYRHLSRIISIHYLFRRALRRAVKQLSKKRYISLKLFRAKLRDGPAPRPVVGVLVGFNFIRDNEVFEERHLLKAIQTLVPGVRAVKGSFFSNVGNGESVCTLYLEIEKLSGNLVSAGEIQKLRRELPSDLKDRIQYLMHPIFMPRNEEEIMRNILTLSDELKYIRDIPQVIISFDEQTDNHVVFLVILLRIVREDSPSIEAVFKKSGTFMEYIHDRVKRVGFVRKRYPKEATVFRVRMPKSHYIRGDHSLDLQRARKDVAEGLSQIGGEIRDFNGGMISKQNELFTEIQRRLGDAVDGHELLLENFFYSVLPVVMRTVLDPRALSTLFLMLLDILDSSNFRQEPSEVRIQEDEDFLYAMLTAEDASIRRELEHFIQGMPGVSPNLATTFVTVYDRPYMGYILRCDDPGMRKSFILALQRACDEYRTKPLIMT